MESAKKINKNNISKHTPHTLYYTLSLFDCTYIIMIIMHSPVARRYI